MNLFKIIFGYSIWIFLGVVVDKINWSVDQTLLGMLSGTVAVSVYSVASTLNTVFINLSTAISSVMLPKVSKMVASYVNAKELTKEFIKIGRIQYYIVFLMLSGFILFGKRFIIWWVGEGFVDSYSVALILLVPLFIPLIQNLGLSIIQAISLKICGCILQSFLNISLLISKNFLHTT